MEWIIGRCGQIADPILFPLNKHNGAGTKSYFGNKLCVGKVRKVKAQFSARWFPQQWLAVGEHRTHQEEKTLNLKEAGRAPSLNPDTTKARHMGARTECLPEIVSFAMTSLCKAKSRKRRWIAPFNSQRDGYSHRPKYCIMCKQFPFPDF